MRLLLLTIFLLCEQFTFGQVALEFVEIAGGFSSPTALRAPADSSNRLFVCEKAGRIKIIDLNTNTVQPETFLDISDKTSTASERGLLGLAFDPQFAVNGTFYLHYTSSGADNIPEGHNVVARYILPSPTATTAIDAEITLVFTSPQDFSNHNGGDLVFGPDSLLYISIGDGGSFGDPNDRAQNPMSFMGTLVRIDVSDLTDDFTYDIPEGNPYFDGVVGLPEIYSIGWRNPWRISFDRLTGDLWVGDVGQSAREEIDFTPVGTGAGLNYGWDCREGDIAYPNSSMACEPNGDYVEPIVALMHSSATMQANSITGGYVYRGSQWPELYGTYICADFVTDIFFSIKSDSLGGWDVFAQPQNTLSGVATFGEDESGELYAASFFNGTVFQITGGISDVRQFDNDFDFEVASFPNPARRMLNLRFDDLSGDQLIKLRLVDLQGRPVLQQTLSLGAGSTTHQLRLPRVAAGVYQLLVSTQNGNKVLSVIIE